MKTFKKFNSVKIFAYDPTVTNNFFLKDILYYSFSLLQKLYLYAPLCRIFTPFFEQILFVFGNIFFGNS